jgi:PncC family amidohydrolase
VFDCGVITYSNEQKTHLLSVPRAVLDEHGAVSEQTARSMSAGVRALANADIGIGVTGIAGPANTAVIRRRALAYAQDGLPSVSFILSLHIIQPKANLQRVVDL